MIPINHPAGGFLSGDQSLGSFHFSFPTSRTSQMKRAFILRVEPPKHGELASFGPEHKFDRRLLADGLRLVQVVVNGKMTSKEDHNLLSKINIQFNT